MSIIIVEGNIAAGKTTLLESLDKNEFNVIDEPMNWYCSLGPYNPLLMHNCGLLSSYSFSSYILTTLANELKNKLVQDKINIVCRSAFSSVDCFAAISYDDGKMTATEFLILKTLKELYCHFLCGFKTYQVYLDTSVENCIKRLKTRGRVEESAIDKTFLKRLENKHKKILTESCSKVRPTFYPLGWDIIIDGNQDPDKIKSDFARFLNGKKL